MADIDVSFRLRIRSHALKRLQRIVSHLALIGLILLGLSGDTPSRRITAMPVTPIYVDCLLNGNLIKSYEFGKPVAAMPGTPTNWKALEDQCLSQLTTDGLAFPPYTGITFRHRER